VTAITSRGTKVALVMPRSARGQLMTDGVETSNKPRHSEPRLLVRKLKVCERHESATKGA
jgi:hypothetical protein